MSFKNKDECKSKLESRGKGVKTKIPKKIHYCWFGRGEKSLLIKSCIASWKKFLPDYEIVEWNEDNFDIHCNTYVEEAYHAKKWAFVTDYVRLYLLYNIGGIYMDTDVEVLRSLDIFLEEEAFSGFEARDSVPTGIMASVKNQKVFFHLLKDYDNKHFVLSDGLLNQTTNVETISKYFMENGLEMNNKEQTINGCTMYPQIYFCPNTFGMIFGINSKKSYTIHHFDGSWKGSRHKNNWKYKICHYFSGRLRNAIGTKNYNKIRG